MGFHTFPVERAGMLEEESRYRYLSREELLGALDPDPGWTVADLGSGTGFYTDDVAPYVGRLYAVDVQEEMHGLYREKGLPENVELVTAEAGDLPVADGELDAAFSTMTFHEFAGEGALAELHRALVPGGVAVHADWTAAGEGEEGPPLDERFDREAAVEHCEAAGFEVACADERVETFLLSVRR